MNSKSQKVAQFAGAKRPSLGVVSLCLAVSVLGISTNSYAGLESWTCDSVATYTGYVAMDRDDGMPQQAREQKTLSAFVHVAQNLPETVQSDIADSDALIRIVQGVYGSQDTPRNLLQKSLRDCASRLASLKQASRD